MKRRMRTTSWLERALAGDCTHRSCWKSFRHAGPCGQLKVTTLSPTSLSVSWHLSAAEVER